MSRSFASASPLAGDGFQLALASVDLEKLGEALEKEDKPKTQNPWWAGAKAIGGGAAAMLAGGAAGLGAAYLAEQMYQKRFGTPIPYGLIAPAAGMIGTGVGIAGMMMRNRQAKVIQDAIESRRRG